MVSVERDFKYAGQVESMEITFETAQDIQLNVVTEDFLSTDIISFYAVRLITWGRGHDLHQCNAGEQIFVQYGTHYDY